MGWYTVTKKVKGRPYLYRQRSFREGGKVRTQRIYLGPGSGFSAGGGGGAYAPEAEGNEREPPVITTTAAHFHDHLQIHDEVFTRKDISIPALVREEKRVREKMSAQGLPTDELPAVRVTLGGKLDRYRRKQEFCVTASKTGQRTAFKREYRRALADRWLREVELRDPVQYNAIRCSMSERHRRARAALTEIILLSNTPHKFMGVLWFMWTGRLPADLRKKVNAQKIGMMDHEGGGWRDEMVKLTAEMIQSDGERVFRKYEARTKTATDRWMLEYEKLKAMGLSAWFSASGKAQRKRADKAWAWMNACEAMERKVEMAWNWHYDGYVL